MKIWFNKASCFFKEFHWFYSLILALFLYAIICYAKFNSINVPITHMDGAFQTASGLFRLLQGNLPGRDFYPYLGIGPIGLLYPVFLLAGANLCASVFASFLMVYMADVLSIAILIHLIFKPKSFLLSLISACALLSAIFLLILSSSAFVGMYAIPHWLEVMLIPGQSLRPLRGSISYLAIFSLYFIVFPEQNRRRKFAYYGITLAIVSLWSNDYALPTAVVVFLLALVNFINDKKAHFFKTTIYLISTSVVFIVLAHWLVTGGHPLKLAIYNFVDVARDQWWYFGPWKAATRVFSIEDVKTILPIIQDQYSHYILAVSFAAIFIFKQLRWELLLVFALGVIALIGGMVACIGGHIGSYYFEGFIFWAKLVALLFGLRLITALLFMVVKWGRKLLYVIVVCSSALVIGANVVYAHQDWINIKQQKNKYAANVYVPELGGYLDQAWMDYINYIKAHRDKNTVEEYSGIWSAFLKRPSAWPVDSAIHALGDIRQSAEILLREKTDIVVTSRRALAHSWLGWNLSADYWLYQILFESYTPAFFSPTTIVWEKNKLQSDGKTVTCRIADSKDRIFLETSETGYYEVHLKTKTDKQKNNRYLTMFENNINFACDETGELSISPYEENPVIPVHVSSKENTDFGFDVRPLGAARVSIESCSAREIPFKDERVLMMSEGADKIYDKNYQNGNIYSDVNFWDRGVSTTRAGFYVFKDKKALAEFKVGNVVKLPDNSMRIITMISGGYGEYLEVTLNGSKLNPDTVGVPTDFRVISDANQLEALASELGKAVFLTDDIQWINGISRQYTGFVVPNTQKNRELFRVPHRVQIPNTTERSIKYATPMGVLLQVTVDGATLDSATAGLPSEFKVLVDE